MESRALWRPLARLPPGCFSAAGRTREVCRALARAVAKSALNTSKKSFRNFAEMRVVGPRDRVNHRLLQASPD